MASFVRRLCGWAILASFTFSLGLGLGSPDHLGPSDDADCGQVSLNSAHPTSQFEAVKPAATAGHCAFCHWQRTVGGARVMARVSGIFQLQLLDRPELAPSQTPRAAAIDLRSSRGPPSQLS